MLGKIVIGFTAFLGLGIILGLFLQPCNAKCRAIRNAYDVARGDHSFVTLGHELNKVIAVHGCIANCGQDGKCWDDPDFIMGQNLSPCDWWEEIPMYENIRFCLENISDYDEAELCVWRAEEKGIMERTGRGLMASHKEYYFKKFFKGKYYESPEKLQEWLDQHKETWA